MTGTATFEYEGRFDPALFAIRRLSNERRDRHLRLPPQCLRIRSDRAREAERAGLTETIVINSCAVTNEAVAQARQSIRRLKRERPGRGSSLPAVRRRPSPRCSPAWPRSIASSATTTRCAVRPGARLARRSTPGQVSASSTAKRSRSPTSWRSPRWRRICWRDFSGGLPRVFVQVQNGCDHRCTFCIIPYGRGNSRSVPMGAVVEQVRALVERGHAEIVLTGVDLTSYGADLPGAPKLGQLTKQILRHVPDLKRLRISSIDSIEVDRDLLDVIAHESASDAASASVAAVGRRSDPEAHEAPAFAAPMRSSSARELRRLRPDIALGADHHRRLPDRDRGDVRALAAIWSRSAT